MITPIRCREGTLGVAINDRVALRLRLRHSNSITGVPGEWNFNGDPLDAAGSR